MTGGRAAPGWRRLAGFLLLFLLYQSAEGIGGRWLHSFPVQAGLMLAALLAAWPVSRWLGYRRLDAYALALCPGAWTWLLAGLLLAAALKLAAVPLGMQLGWIAAGSGAPAPSLANLASALPMLLLSTFVPSLAEDILTRGYPYRAAGLTWRNGIGFVIASTALYVLNHLYRLHLGPGEWLLLSSYGLTYATALWRSGTLWAAVGLHWGWNLGNGMADVFWPDAQPLAMAPWLSIGAHVLMFALVMTMMPLRRAIRASA